MAVEILTTSPAADVVDLPKNTTTSSVTRGAICKLSSGEWAPVATVTDGTTTNILGVSTNESQGSGDLSGARVACHIADGLIDYEFPLNTATSITAGDRLILVSGQSAQLAKAATTTDAEVAIAVKGAGTSVSRVRCRMIPAVLTD